MVWWHALLTGVWGGVVALERRAFLQAMLSRPIAAATITGALLDDVGSGLATGVLFELLHLGGASLGGVHPEHETLPAVASASMAAAMANASGSNGTPAMWALAILVCAPTGWLGQVLESRLDVRARKYLGRARDATDAREFQRAARQNLRAMWPQFVFYGASSAAASLAGHALASSLEAAPLPLLRGLAWAYPAMVVMASGVAVRGSHAEGRHRLGLAAATAVGLARWWWPV